MNLNEHDIEKVVTLTEDPEFSVVKDFDKCILKTCWTVRWETGSKDVNNVPFELFGKAATEAKNLNLRRGMHVRVIFQIECFKFPQLKAWKVMIVTPGDSDEVPA